MCDLESSQVLLLAPAPAPGPPSLLPFHFNLWLNIKLFLEIVFEDKTVTRIPAGPCRHLLHQLA